MFIWLIIGGGLVLLFLYELWSGKAWTPTNSVLRAFFGDDGERWASREDDAVTYWIVTATSIAGATYCFAKYTGWSGFDWL